MKRLSNLFSFEPLSIIHFSIKREMSSPLLPTEVKIMMMKIQFRIYFLDTLWNKYKNAWVSYKYFSW